MRYETPAAFRQAMEDPPATWISSFAAMAHELKMAETTPERATARLNDYWATLFP